MRYHLLQKFFGKMVKIKETSFFSTKGMTLMFGNCIGFVKFTSKATFIQHTRVEAISRQT